MNSSLEPPRTVVFALCGSFCTFETVLPQIIRLRACGWEVLPMLSYAASALDTRFGRAADWKQRLEEATGHRPLEDLREAEPLGPKHMAQALVIAPCTGTTMGFPAAWERWRRCCSAKIIISFPLARTTATKSPAA